MLVKRAYVACVYVCVSRKARSVSVCACVCVCVCVYVCVLRKARAACDLVDQQVHEKCESPFLSASDFDDPLSLTYETFIRGGFFRTLHDNFP